MIVNLNKEDLVALIRGFKSSYSSLDYIIANNLGDYNDYQGRVAWKDDELKILSEDHLWTIYNDLKV